MEELPEPWGSEGHGEETIKMNYWDVCVIKVVLTLDHLRSSFSLTPSSAVLIMIVRGVGFSAAGKISSIRSDK